MTTMTSGIAAMHCWEGWTVGGWIGVGTFGCGICGLAGHTSFGGWGWRAGRRAAGWADRSTDRRISQHADERASGWSVGRWDERLLTWDQNRVEMLIRHY